MTYTLFLDTCYTFTLFFVHFSFFKTLFLKRLHIRDERTKVLHPMENRATLSP